MATKKKEEKIKKAEEAVYLKRQLLRFEKYKGREDLLNTLLEDDKEYTLADVDGMIEKFFKN